MKKNKGKINKSCGRSHKNGMWVIRRALPKAVLSDICLLAHSFIHSFIHLVIKYLPIWWDPKMSRWLPLRSSGIYSNFPPSYIKCVCYVVQSKMRKCWMKNILKEVGIICYVVLIGVWGCCLRTWWFSSPDPGRWKWFWNFLQTRSLFSRGLCASQECSASWLPFQQV